MYRSRKAITLSPSGNIPIGDTYPMVPVNSVVKDPQQLGTIPIRTGEIRCSYVMLDRFKIPPIAPAVTLWFNGRRAGYILANQESHDASTLQRHQ